MTGDGESTVIKLPYHLGDRYSVSKWWRIQRLPAENTGSNTANLYVWVFPSLYWDPEWLDPAGPDIDLHVNFLGGEGMMRIVITSID